MNTNDQLTEISKYLEKISNSLEKLVSFNENSKKSNTDSNNLLLEKWYKLNLLDEKPFPTPWNHNKENYNENDKLN